MGVYTLSYRECGHPRHFCHATLADFEMISTTTGSWIRSRLRRDRIQLPVVAEIISSLQKLHDKGDEGVHTLDGIDVYLQRLQTADVTLGDRIQSPSGGF